MAKGKSGKKSKATKAAPAEDPDAFIGEALDLFKQGDWVRARPLLAAMADDTGLSQSQRDRAAELRDATRPEPTALLVGLGCVGLIALVFVVTMLLQP